MRIAQVAPLFESVPPRGYGGTERVVHYLTEELVRRGHEVTLFASGDSQTSAELHACVPSALRLGTDYIDATIYEAVQLETVFRHAHRFDVIHFHTGHLHYATSSRLDVAQVTTQHGRLDIPELAQLYWVFDDIPLVSISNAQREPLPQARWAATVHHGLPPDLYSLEPEPGDYFAFVGRISPEKRVDRAIEVATALGVPLRIAAKVDKVDREYFESSIRPLIEGSELVELIGEVGDEDKRKLLCGARALLFPIDWPEPFGLVMIEAMACGTPAIAWRHGSVPEVMCDGVTGFVVESLEQAITAAEEVGSIDRVGVRRYFEQRFSAGRMAADYERVYSHLILERRTGRRRLSRGLVSA